MREGADGGCPGFLHLHGTDHLCKLLFLEKKDRHPHSGESWPRSSHTCLWTGVGIQHQEVRSRAGGELPRLRPSLQSG